MIFLLPPSETKRDGGASESTLDFGALSFASLDRPRRSAAAALVRLSRDVDASMTALKIGPRLRDEVSRNRLLKRSPTLPALERYTGVAFDPIGASHLDAEATSWAASHVAIHSALFGLLGATDRIPAYRLSHDSRLPGVSLKALWATPIRRALASLAAPVVDLRSEAYAELGPAPRDSVYVRVVTDDGDRRRALNHFNKKTKGTLVARLLADRPDLSSVDDFVVWAREQGIVVEPSVGELVVVSESVLRD
ncbi:peroxide stress protein YaaA [Frondihabitans sucicola]|uniref:Peroxide stress protein YaaA n=1 Tax=Frondihabitans sucicola TaxID=1268041 RepID=A0ABM8GRW1_9MICO|nr:peroxide stress protein YaaA [Frondihabitans sucicola]BDZ51034.1 peroxide stress protein YaaA [Frondihabitans sucicola]